MYILHLFLLFTSYMCSMFPISMFSTNADGTFTISPDPLLNIRPMMHFPNGDFAFSLFPFPSISMPVEDKFNLPNSNYSGSDRNNGAQTVTIRMIMSGKEVGSIIGKKGDNVKKIREQSGARINISDGSCPERIVSVSGTVEKVSSAFLFICQKFEDDYIGIDKDKSDRYICPPVTLRLLVPATQCGSIIGKSGCKIKEIRDMCGASIQVASEFLPSSSERSVTVSGTANSVAKCIKQISLILLETPIRFGTVQYKPKLPYSNISAPLPPVHCIPPLVPFNSSTQEALKPMNNISSTNIQPPMGIFPMQPGQLFPTNLVPAFYTDPFNFGNCPTSMPIWLKHQSSLSYPSTPDIQSPSIVSQSNCPQQMIEIIISNDLIGCIIGRGGNTINEIRSMSGAQIKISDGEDLTTERHIIISGSAESINTAQLLINSNIQSYRNSVSTQKSMDQNDSNNPNTNCSTNSMSSRESQFNCNNIQKNPGKLPSTNFTTDGNRRTDHIHYAPY